MLVHSSFDLLRIVAIYWYKIQSGRVSSVGTVYIIQQIKQYRHVLNTSIFLYMHLHMYQNVYNFSFQNELENSSNVFNSIKFDRKKQSINSSNFNCFHFYTRIYICILHRYWAQLSWQAYNTHTFKVSIFANALLFCMGYCTHSYRCF